MLAKTEEASTKQQAPIWAAIEIILICVGLFAQLVKPHGISGADAVVRFQAISTLLESGKIPDMKFSIVGPAFSIPFWLLGKIFLTPETWLARYNLFIFAAGLLVMTLLLKGRIDQSLLRKFFLILLVGSLFSSQLTNYYGEMFTATCVGVGILAAVFKPSLGAWSVIVLGVVNTPASIAGLALVVLKRMLERKHWRYILAVVAALALIGLEAWIRRGSPFNTGYAGDHGNRTIMPYSGLPDFSYPFFFGILSILFSFGKGLFFFAPGLLLPIRKRILATGEGAMQQLYSVYLLWIAFLIGLILVYAKWWAWYGGWAWGPRFFVFAALPASLTLAVRLRSINGSLIANLATVGVLGLSFWVGIDGAVFGQQNMDICTNNQYALEFLCHYVPEFSALWRPFVVPPQIGLGGILYIVYSVIVFGYLAFPLLRAIATQAIGQIAAYSQPYLKLGTWRF